MQHWKITFIILVFGQHIAAQTIKGRVTDTNDNALFGANISIKGTYDGTITNNEGKFEFKTSSIGTQTLSVSYIGYQNNEQTIEIEKGKFLDVDVKLHEKSTQLNDVVITAGTFEAGDKKRGIQLRTLDMLTTANSNGDIFGALNTLPGNQTVGEDGGLFVRGGEKYETKTFVDGMLVSNPYSSKVPDLPARGRFSPMLFTGVSFSAGGYSSEYGQALSSALILNTMAFPSKSLTSLSILPFGGGINTTVKRDSTSFSLTLDYYNMAPYYSLIKQSTKWTHFPEDLSSTMMFRKKIGKSGFLKSFAQLSSNKLGMELPDYLTTPGNIHFKLTNNDIYVNSVYTVSVGNGWSLKTGASFNYDDELLGFDNFSLNTYNRVSQFRFSAQKNVTPNILLKTGIELNYQSYKQNYTRTDSAFQAIMNYQSTIAAAFVEAEWKVSRKISVRLGSRMEYAALLSETRIVPRLSMAYKTGANSQVSLAYGVFNQMPKEDYMKFKPALSSEMATHYIANYEYTIENRLFRIEAFSKEYSKLVRYTALNDPNPLSYNNDGHGYARGVELFLRDQKTLKNGDFWVSYTYLDTKKLYQDMPSMQRPILFSRHSVNLVGKYFFMAIKSQVGITYQYASGRPYYIPGIGSTTMNYTSDFHNLSANISYLVRLFDYFTVIHFSASNIFGFNQVYGYHFTKESDSSGDYTAHPITSPAKRFFVLGIFITLDKSNSQF